MSDDAADATPQHEDLVAAKPQAPPSSNPFAHSASITLSVPESVEVKLVDASALADYEVWVLLTSILSSAFIGFLVATLQVAAEVRSMFAWTTVVFGLLLVVCAIMAKSKRKRLTTRTRRIRLRVGTAEHDSDS